MNLDLTILIAVIASPFAILGVMTTLFLWLRSESNADRRRSDENFEKHQKEMTEISKNIADVSKNMDKTIVAIQFEMKDFHNKLVEIEKDRKAQ
jgi:flagellar basal body-associated protein FliL